MSSFIDNGGKCGDRPRVVAMPQHEPGDLASFVRGFVSRLGTARAVAKAIGLTEGRVGRVMRGEGSMEVGNLLRLADIAGEPPSKVLRLAGKAEEAELIERIYSVGVPPLSKSQRELLQTWERLPDQARQHFKLLMRDVERRDPGLREQVPKYEPARKRRTG